MLLYLAKRLCFAVVTLLSVLTLIFLMVRVLPGDPVLMILGDQASPESVAALRQRLGLDQPIGLQYVQFLGSAVKGDLGNSMVTGRPVTEEVMSVLPYTLELTFASLVVGLILGVPTGVWAAVKRSKLASSA